MLECWDFSEENKKNRRPVQVYFKSNFLVPHTSSVCILNQFSRQCLVPVTKRSCLKYQYHFTGFILVPNTIHIGEQWIAKWISRKSGAESCTVWGWEGDLPIIHAAVKVLHIAFQSTSCQSQSNQIISK